MKLVLLPISALLLLAGCDASMSRFDDVDASVGGLADGGGEALSGDGSTTESSGTTDNTTAGADAGADDATTTTTDGTGTSDDGTDDTSGDGSGGSGGSGGTVDSIPPDDVQTFTGVSGATTQTVSLSLTFPASADYARVDVRRYAAATAGDCTAGVVAKRYAGPTFPASDTFDDDTGGAGRVFSYRTCVYDSANNLADGKKVEAVTSVPHMIFATSKSFNGALTEVPVTLAVPNAAWTGPERADSYCQQLGATIAGAAGETWRALLSDDFLDASVHVAVTGEVQALNGAVIASDATDLFDAGGNLSASVKFTETGGTRTDVWTGSQADGLRHTETCFNWSSNLAFDSGRLGLVDSSATPDFQWIAGASDTCNTTHGLYCVSQVAEDPLARFDGATGGAAGEITLAIEPPTKVANVARIEIYRLAGATAPDTLCNNTVGTAVQTIQPVTASAVTVTDTGLAAGAYSYRACVFGAYGNVLTTEKTENISAN